VKLDAWERARRAIVAYQGADSVAFVAGCQDKLRISQSVFAPIIALT
jgi:hypothetical protein